MKPNKLAQLALQLLAFHANPGTASDAVTADDERPYVCDTVAENLEHYPLKWLKKTSFAAALAKLLVATGVGLGLPAVAVPRDRGHPRGRPRPAAAATASATRNLTRLMTQGKRPVGSYSARSREDQVPKENVELKSDDCNNGEYPSGGNGGDQRRKGYGNMTPLLQDARHTKAERALERTLPRRRTKIARIKRNLAAVYARWETHVANDLDATVGGSFT